jgi:FeS assembly SUF system regulator
MLRIAKLTDYATGLTVQLARSPGRQVSAQQLSLEMGLPLPTVAALLKRLGRAGLVSSARGVGGGYCLARAPRDISVADVISAIEGPVALTECALGSGRCAVESACATRANWQVISRAVQVALDAVSLADMTAPVARTMEIRGLSNQGLGKA